MPKFQPKTTKQLRAIFALAKPLNCAKEDLEELAADVSGGRVDRLSMLSFAEANEIIRRLGGEPFNGSGTPRRTVNYQRQQAGVQQIAQPDHLQMMRDLAAGRGWTEATLNGFCRRMLKGNSLPRTTAETNKIIEALKAMNKRDRVKEAA